MLQKVLQIAWTLLVWLPLGGALGLSAPAAVSEEASLADPTNVEKVVPVKRIDRPQPKRGHRGSRALKLHVICHNLHAQRRLGDCQGHRLSNGLNAPLVT
jgi:hypothetical protein